jgi:hypothetical protein
LIVKLPVVVPPFAVADNWATVVWVTAFVNTVNEALLLPAGIVTTDAYDPMAPDPLTAAICTSVSTATGWLKFTVAVVVEPPVTDAGLKIKLPGVPTLTLRDPVLLPPFAVALI